MKKVNPIIQGIVIAFVSIIFIAAYDYHSHSEYADNYHTHNDSHSHYEYADNNHSHSAGWNSYADENHSHPYDYAEKNHDHHGILNSSTFLNSYAKENHTHDIYDDYYLKQRISDLEDKIFELELKID